MCAGEERRGGFSPLTFRPGPGLHLGWGEGRPRGRPCASGCLHTPPPRHAAHPTLPQPLDPLVEPSLCTHPRDLETQECRFLDKEDWGPRRTSKEIGHLQNDCMR